MINPCPSSLSVNELIKNIKFIQSNFLITNKVLSQDNTKINCTHVIFDDDEELLSHLESYDENKFIRNLYSNGSFQWSKSLRMTHLANKTKIGKELIIASNNCKIPLSKIKLTKSQLKPMS